MNTVLLIALVSSMVAIGLGDKCYNDASAYGSDNCGSPESRGQGLCYQFQCNNRWYRGCNVAPITSGLSASVGCEAGKVAAGGNCLTAQCRYCDSDRCNNMGSNGVAMKSGLAASLILPTVAMLFRQ